MSKLIGKISGNDWSVAPEGAKYVDLHHIYNDASVKEWCDQKLWVKSAVDYWYGDGSYSGRVNDDFSNKDRYISRERDLEGVEEVVKYSSLEELPVGWFVKDPEGYISLWDGDTLYTLHSDSRSLQWGDGAVNAFIGFNYIPDSGCSIVAYSDRYNGEWTPVDNAKELRKKELQEQIANLTKELEEL